MSTRVKVPCHFCYSESYERPMGYYLDEETLKPTLCPKCFGSSSVELRVISSIKHRLIETDEGLDTYELCQDEEYDPVLWHEFLKFA